MKTPLDKVLIWTVAKHGRPWTLDHYQSKTRELLTALRQAHQKFTRLTSIGSDQAVAVSEDLVGLAELVRVQAFNAEHLEDYESLDDKGRLTSKSLSKIGFSITYCSSSKEDSSITPSEAGGIDLSIQGGSSGDERSASTVLKLPTDAISDLHDPQTARRLLRILVETWDCSFGGVSLQRYQQAVRAGETDSYAGQWLFYLPFPNLAKCLPNGIALERFAKGILIETTPHLPDADEPEDVAAGKRVSDALDELGLIRNSTYATAGWPPDREEHLYEQFISGAPPDRKYAVHCINFDGYDPDRKVLLYAKLFRPLRRHPKEWGLRGWDGPVLNEAKRQARAAAKAGGVPIEWHIGLEEPAHQVRQLLADYTSITEQQLRVIYTPLDEALRSPPPR